MIEIDAGSTRIRWKLSRCMPSASARIALIGSPCETAAQTASASVLGAQPVVPGADRPDRPRRHLRHRLPAREPDGGGLLLHRAPELLLAQLAQRLARPLAVPALDQTLLDRDRTGLGAAATSACAVCRQRRSGEVTTVRSGTPAIRRPTSAACRWPTSSSSTPEDRPARMPAVLAEVRPWRISRTVVMGRTESTEIGSGRGPTAR